MFEGLNIVNMIESKWVNNDYLKNDGVNEYRISSIGENEVLKFQLLKADNFNFIDSNFEITSL